MKPLDFSERAGLPAHRAVMRRRAWYVVFGISRLEKDQTITENDVAERIHTVYDDIEPGDIAGVIDTYLEQRSNT